MAVPSNPTVAEICTKGLERGGQYNPDSDQQDLAEDHFLQEVKADIMKVVPYHPLLQTTALSLTVRGQQRSTMPADHNRTLAVVLLDGPDDWRVTLTGGSTTTMTMPSSFTSDDDTLAGKFVVSLSGTGSSQYGQIIAYDSSTRIATLDTALSSAVASGTAVLIATTQEKLYPNNFDDIPDYFPIQPQIGKPKRASVYLQQLHLFPSPDKVYGLLHHYYVDLSKVDEAGSVFIQMLREWRSLWIQGIGAYTMQRYDDARFPAAWALYQGQLKALAGDTAQYSRCEGAR